MFLKGRAGSANVSIMASGKFGLPFGFRNSKINSLFFRYSDSPIFATNNDLQ